MANGNFMEQANNLIFVGGTGTGKNHLAIALAVSAIHQEKRVRFYNDVDLVNLLEKEKQLGKSGSLAKRLIQIDAVILDELGYVPASKVGSELLFDVIITAYERMSLIVITNLPFENWTEVLGSERLTGAALDRLTHRCHILEASGESFRLQDAKRRRTKRSSSSQAKTK